MNRKSWKSVSFVLAAALVGATVSACSSDNGAPAPAASGNDADASVTPNAAPDAGPPPAKPKPDAAPPVTPSDDAGEEPEPTDPLDACITKCIDDAPNAGDKFDGIFECADTKCPAACDPNGGTPEPDAGAADGGTCTKVGPGAGKFTMGDDVCDVCLAQRCCDAVGACVNDTECDKLNQCVDACYANN